jgi:hypothetical protein
MLFHGQCHFHLRLSAINRLLVMLFLSQCLCCQRRSAFSRLKVTSLVAEYFFLLKLQHMLPTLLMPLLLQLMPVLAAPQ